MWTELELDPLLAPASTRPRSGAGRLCGFTLLLTISIFALRPLDICAAEGNLLERASSRFSKITFTDCERKLLRNASTGQMSFCGPSGTETDQVPADVGKRRTQYDVDASLLSWICTDPEVVKLVDSRGVQVHAARIVGVLELSFVKISFPLILHRTRFVDTVRFAHGFLNTLDLSGSKITGLSAEGANLAGDLILSGDFAALEEVALTGASLNGDLNAENANFEDIKESLNADGARVEGDVNFEKMHSRGSVSLAGAKIGGDLDAEAGTFEGGEGEALNAERANISGNIFLRNGFHSKGEVDFDSVKASSLEAEDGIFESTKGDAFSVDGATFEGDVRLGGGFIAKGPVSMIGTAIRGDLDAEGGTFEDPDGTAFDGDGMVVRGDIRFSDGFRSVGEVQMRGVNVGGDIKGNGGAFVNQGGEALDVSGSNVDRYVLLGNGILFRGEVNLDAASVGRDLIVSNAKCSSGSALRARQTAIRGAFFWKSLDPHCVAGVTST